MYAPKVDIKPIDPNEPPVPRGYASLTEQQKYEKMWTVEDYRKVAPGEAAASTFLAVAKPDPRAQVIDFGCGTGRGSAMLATLGKVQMIMVDFAANCLDDWVRGMMKHNPASMSFMQHDLTNELPTHATYGFCTDVMEHIPTEDVDRVLLNILQASRNVFFRISTTDDVMGPAYLGGPLHLTVRDYEWWKKKFVELECTLLHSEDLGGAVDFYVSAWKQELPDMEVNTKSYKVLENIRENAKWPVRRITPGQLQDTEIMILAGGPSLNDFEDEILENYRNGMKVVTVNGAYHWARERGITRVNQCVLDARPFNLRFVTPANPECFYFIGTQCDPALFEALPHNRTWAWHCSTSKEAVETACEYYDDPHFINGGSTVTSRAIVLMRVLGFKNQIIYGFDSCLTEEEHHAYSQPENDDIDEPLVPVMIGDRTFQCYPWMALQAFEFIRLQQYADIEFNLTVKGDGLIAYILETGATLPPMEELQ